MTLYTYSFTTRPATEQTVVIPLTAPEGTYQVLFSADVDFDDIPLVVEATASAGTLTFELSGVNVDGIGSCQYRVINDDNDVIVSGTVYHDVPKSNNVAAEVEAQLRNVVTRRHLWDLAELTDLPDAAFLPGLYYDTTNNIAGIGNTVVEIFTLPGVIVQRVTGIDSGRIAVRRYWGGNWSSWVVSAVV